MSVARRVIIVGVGALVIVLGLGLVSIVRSDGVPAPDPSPSPQVEQTLLMQVLDGDGYAVANAVIGVEPPQDEPLTTILVIPGSLLVPGGDDSVTLGLTPQSPDTLAGLVALEQVLGLRVDAGLTLDRLAFAGLVDGVNGVWVELERPVLLPEIGDDGRLRVLGPGWVKMDGVAAADYAVLRIPGENDDDRMERFSAILRSVIAALPPTDDQLRQLVTSLGSLAQSTVPTEDLVPFLLSVRTDVEFGDVRIDTLPVEVIRGGARPASVAAPQAQSLVRVLFPDARVAADDAGMTG